MANQKKAGRAPGSNIVASQQQQRRSALPSRGFRLRYFFVFDNSSSVASLLDGRNVHEHVFTAALRLNKSIALGRIEPLHGTFLAFIAPVSLRADEYVKPTGRKASAPTWTRDPPRSMWPFSLFPQAITKLFAFKVWLAETFWLQDRCFLRPGVIQWQRK